MYMCQNIFVLYAVSDPMSLSLPHQTTTAPMMTTTPNTQNTDSIRNALTLTWSKAKMSAKRSSEYLEGIRCK